MPIKKCTRKNGGSGWQFGSGHCFATRKEALAQMAAMYENGYKGESKLTLADKVAIQLVVKKEEERLDKEFGKDE